MSAYDSAFPIPRVGDFGRGESGLTKREYFAACALQGFIACPNVSGPDKEVAEAAVRFADALIAALNEVKP